jgi:Arc/MetJ-type ribon-helix-helix transcriptional regulator
VENVREALEELETERDDIIKKHESLANKATTSLNRCDFEDDTELDITQVTERMQWIF